MGEIIGIISIKGGVGKTTTVVGLGSALARDYGKKVLLVDANFSAPNLGLHVGCVAPAITLHEVMQRKARPEQAVYDTEHGFHLMPGALVHRKVNPYKLKNRLERLKDAYDVILIDSSPSLNEEFLSVMFASDRLFIVTTPDHVTLSTTMRAVMLAREKKVSIEGLILTKVYGRKFELTPQQVEEVSGCNVLAVVPHDTGFLEALSRQIPLSEMRSNGAVKEYRELAGAIIGQNRDPGMIRRAMRSFMGIIPSTHEKNRKEYSDGIQAMQQASEEEGRSKKSILNNSSRRR